MTDINRETTTSSPPCSSEPKLPTVWFITGCSGVGGFGNIMLNKLIKQGHYVAATSRCLKRLMEDVKSELINDNNFLALQVNVEIEASVIDAIKQTIDKFSRIDIIVNNAGAGVFGPLEEITDSQTRSIYDVNVFGPLNIIRNALPFLRANKQFILGPRIVNIDSVGGYTSAFSGCSIYCSSKFALHGISESLSTELSTLSPSSSKIHTINVAPGFFGTNFFSNVKLSSLPRINDYASTHSFVDNLIQSTNDHKGDPSIVIDLIIKVSLSENPPLHYFIGPDSYDLWEKKLATLQKDISTDKEICIDTDRK